jgi:hypothetical protein
MVISDEDNEMDLDEEDDDGPYPFAAPANSRGHHQRYAIV